MLDSGAAFDLIFSATRVDNVPLVFLPFLALRTPVSTCITVKRDFLSIGVICTCHIPFNRYVSQFTDYLLSR